MHILWLPKAAWSTASGVPWAARPRWPQSCWSCSRQRYSWWENHLFPVIFKQALLHGCATPIPEPVTQPFHNHHPQYFARWSVSGQELQKHSTKPGCASQVSPSFTYSFVFTNFLLVAFSTDDKVQNPIKAFAGSQVSYGLLYHMLFTANFVG